MRDITERLDASAQLANDAAHETVGARRESLFEEEAIYRDAAKEIRRLRLTLLKISYAGAPDFDASEAARTALCPESN